MVFHSQHSTNSENFQLVSVAATFQLDEDNKIPTFEFNWKSLFEIESKVKQTKKKTKTKHH